MPARPAALVLALSLALAGCLETTGGAAVQPVSAKTSAPSAKQPGPAAAKASLAQQVRADLLNGCLREHGGLFGGEKVQSQCTCYAEGMLKTMGKDDLEFYLRYKVIPTLSTARPENVKKTCGI